MFTVFLLFASLGGITPCFLLYLKFKRFNQNALETSGEILDIAENITTDSDGHERKEFLATVKFRTIFETLTTQAKLPSEKYDVGNTIKVYYNSENTNEVVLDKKVSEKNFLYLCLILTSVCLFISIYFNQEIIGFYKETPIFFYALLGSSVLSAGLFFFSKTLKFR